MTDDEIVGWHHQLDGHEFEHTLGDGEGQAGALDLRLGPQGPALLASGKASPHARCSGASPHARCSGASRDSSPVEAGA